MEKTEEYIEKARDAALSDNGVIVNCGDPNSGAKVSSGLDRPPLGAAPYSVVVPARIHELTEAILRYIDDPQLNRDKLAVMKTWARETVEQLDLLDTMLIYK